MFLERDFSACSSSVKYFFHVAFRCSLRVVKPYKDKFTTVSISIRAPCGLGWAWAGGGHSGGAEEFADVQAMGMTRETPIVDSGFLTPVLRHEF